MGAVAAAVGGGLLGAGLSSIFGGGRDEGGGGEPTAFQRAMAEHATAQYKAKAQKHGVSVQKAAQTRVADLGATETAVNKGLVRENRARRPSGIFAQGAETRGAAPEPRIEPQPPRRSTQEFSLSRRPRRRGGIFNEGTNQQQAPGGLLG